jgi:hypothetical protein
MAVYFEENSILLSVPKSGDIRVTKSYLTYHSKLTYQVLRVPLELETDLGSIPQVLQNIFPKDGKAVFAYILHDWLYKTGLYSQKMCDDILEEAMESLGVSWWRRRAVRAGLRVGGFVAYNNHRKKDKNENSN